QLGHSAQKRTRPQAEAEETKYGLARNLAMKSVWLGRNFLSRSAAGEASCSFALAIQGGGTSGGHLIENFACARQIAFFMKDQSKVAGQTHTLNRNLVQLPGTQLT